MSYLTEAQRAQLTRAEVEWLRTVEEEQVLMEDLFPERYAAPPVDVRLTAIEEENFKLRKKLQEYSKGSGPKQRHMRFDTGINIAKEFQGQRRVFEEVEQENGVLHRQRLGAEADGDDMGAGARDALDALAARQSRSEFNYGSMGRGSMGGASTQVPWTEFQKGDEVHYNDQGTWVNATVLHVDGNVSPPSYTVKLLPQRGGSERSTDYSRLRKMPSKFKK